MKIFKNLVLIVIVLFLGSAIISGIKDGLTKDDSNTVKEIKQESKNETNQDVKKEANTEVKESKDKTEVKKNEDKEENTGLAEYKGIISKQIQVKPVWNGSHNKKIGEYATVYYDPNELKDNVLIKFYNDNIENSKYNYFVLRSINNQNKGIFFAGCNQIFDYGTLDKEGGIDKKEKTGVIEDNKIKYY